MESMNIFYLCMFLSVLFSLIAIYLSNIVRSGRHECKKDIM